MVEYIKTILKEHPEYKNSKFLLTNKERDKLFSKNGDHIEVIFDKKCEVSFYKISPKMKKEKLDIESLRKLGICCLGLKDPSVHQMLKYLVLPEMEIERIFNSLRFKYVTAVYESGFSKPFQLFDFSCNKAFQSLAGITIYQGNTKNRKPNDYFWKEKKFNKKSKSLCWEQEKKALRFILSYIKKYNSKEINKSYLELIAIKPGFHELWIHNKYFHERYHDKKPRSIALNILKWKNKKSLLKLSSFPKEINKKDYLSFAPCNITEGPFVYRKNLEISYIDEIRLIRSQKQLNELHKKFYILDYYPSHNMIQSRDKLTLLLRKAEKYTKFL